MEKEETGLNKRVQKDPVAASFLLASWGRARHPFSFFLTAFPYITLVPLNFTVFLPLPTKCGWCINQYYLAQRKWLFFIGVLLVLFLRFNNSLETFELSDARI